MRYEVFEKFFADTRLHFGLVEISDHSVERPLRQAMGFREPAVGSGRPEQWTFRLLDSRPSHLNK